MNAMTQDQFASAIATGIAQGLAQYQQAKADSYIDLYSILIGQIVFVRTVTMTNVGVLAAVTEEGLILEEGAVWIANTGHWSTFCNQGTADDVEPFGKGPVIMPKGGIIDVGQMPCIPKKK